MSKKKEVTEMNERMEGEFDDAEERKKVTRNYYSSRPKTFDTMLGGYTQVHDADIQESNQLLQTLFKVFFFISVPHFCFTKFILIIYLSNIKINLAHRIVLNLVVVLVE